MEEAVAESSGGRAWAAATSPWFWMVAGWLWLVPFGCESTTESNNEDAGSDAVDTAVDTFPSDAGAADTTDTATGRDSAADPCEADNRQPLSAPAAGELFALERADDAVSIDGKIDEIEGRWLTFTDRDGESDNTVRMGSRWTPDGLYLGFEIEDEDIETPDEVDAWKNDGVEIAVDPDGSGGDDFAGDEHKWVIQANGDLRVGTADPGWWETVDNPDGIERAASETDDGYRIELAVEWSVLEVTPEIGDTMGLVVRAVDRDGGEVAYLVDPENAGVSTPSSWGPLELAGESCRYAPDGTGGMDASTSDADGGMMDAEGDAPLDVGPNTRVLREDKHMGHDKLVVESGETLLVDGEVTLTWDGFDTPDRGAHPALLIGGTVRFANEGDKLILDQTAENLGLHTNLQDGAQFGDGKGTIIFRGEVDLLDDKDSAPGRGKVLFPPESGRAVVNGVAWPDGSGKRETSGECAGKHASGVGFSWADDNGDLVMKNVLIWGFSSNLFYWHNHHGSLTLIDSSIEHNGSRGITPPGGGLEMRDVTLNIGGKNARQHHNCGSGLTAFQVETDDGGHREAHLENVHVISRAERFDGQEVRYPTDGGMFGQYYTPGSFTFHLDNSHSEVSTGSPSHVTVEGSWGDNARRLDHEIVDRLTGSN